MVTSNAVPERSVQRPEIQALRALAVGAVVLYHFWPKFSPAGFVGVDVFFVVSGFLITGILLREGTRTGRISLTRFYWRRARRILPAAVLLLAVSAVLTMVFVPDRERFAFGREILASTLYAENWLLAIDSQVPATADLESSPAQHFWSLSVEEQFYIGWPWLLVMGMALARRFSTGAHWPVVAILAVTTVASLVHCIALTAVDHNLAYFSTFSRAWEFGVGGLLACAPVVAAATLERTRAVASWIGIAAIVTGILTFTDPEIFPGAIALIPVAGTVAVIWAGNPSVPWSPTVIARQRPVQWVGDISYSLYLWHWPIVLFTPFITGQPSQWWVMLMLLGLSVLLSWLTKIWVEDRFRLGHKNPPQAPLAKRRQSAMRRNEEIRHARVAEG